MSFMHGVPENLQALRKIRNAVRFPKDSKPQPVGRVQHNEKRQEMPPNRLKKC